MNKRKLISLLFSRRKDSTVWTGPTWTEVLGNLTNNPILGTEQLINGNMESGDPTIATWAYNAATGTRFSEERTGGSGNYSMLLTSTSATFGTHARQNSTSTANKWVHFSAWHKNGSQTGILRLYNNGLVPAGVEINLNSTDWTNYVLDNVLTTANSRIGLVLAGNTLGATSYWDDASVKEFTLSELFRTTPFSSDGTFGVKITSLIPGSVAGVVINLDNALSPANFVFGYHAGSTIVLGKCVAGIYTSLIKTASTFVSGAVLQIVKTGTTYTLKYNGSTIGSSQTISDSGVINNVLVGWMSTNSGNIFDTSVSPNA